jgi:5-methyltetrahydrofolate--homocysteine methyltransferase
MTFDTRGYTMMGVSPAQAVAALHELGAAAAGGNCGNGPDEIEGVIAGMRQALVHVGGNTSRASTTDDRRPTTGAWSVVSGRSSRLRLVAKSNAGMPEIVDGRAVYSGTPEVMATYARRVRALGADIIGACCGSTPAHVRAMARALREEPPLDPSEVTPAMAPAETRRSRRG